MFYDTRLTISAAITGIKLQTFNVIKLFESKTVILLPIVLILN